MNVKSRDWMWMISGFSLLLLVGCSEETTTGSMKAKSPTVSMATPTEEKMTYAPDLAEKPKIKKEEEKKVTKNEAPKMDVALNTKVSVDPGGSFAASDHLKPVYFDLHSSKLSDEAMTLVQDNAAWIKTQPPFLLEIVGVTDQRGSSARNKTLAERRATRVKDAYIAMGIDPERIQIVAVGEESEKCSELTEECFKLSRRADTKIEQKALLAQR